MTRSDATAGVRRGSGSAYRSQLFGRFVATIGRAFPPGTGAAILDLGPTVPENLVFWTERGYRLVAQPLVGREDPRAVVARLAERRFAGVLCWNVLELLDEPERGPLAEWLVGRLSPGGALFAVFDGDGRTPAPVMRYRVGGPDLLRIEPAERVGPSEAISTKRVEEMFAALAPLKITVMRHGSREVLGVLPAGPIRVP